MRHLAQTLIPPPSGLLGEAEAEAEGSHDVEKVLRNLELQPCGENFLEKFQNV